LAYATAEYVFPWNYLQMNKHNEELNASFSYQTVHIVIIKPTVRKMAAIITFKSRNCKNRYPIISRVWFRWWIAQLTFHSQLGSRKLAANTFMRWQTPKLPI